MHKIQGEILGLATVLNIKKILRKILFYNCWSPRLKENFRKSLAGFSFKFEAMRNGISVQKQGSGIIFCKGARKIIVPATDPIFELLHVAAEFDKFFSVKSLEYRNSTIDFTRDISIMGYIIRTNLGTVLELESCTVGYNKHYQVKPGDIVFDCGAFCGIYALLISKQIGKNGRIYCFEPDEKNAEILLHNIKRNGIKNMIVVKKGIWNSDGKMPFDPGHDAVSSVVFVNTIGGESPSIEVTTIPSFLESQHLSKLDFVKMDIEGAELEAVEGCLDFLKNHLVNFAIASYHLRDGQETYHKLEPLFEKAGYGCITEITDTITTYAWPKASEKRAK